MDLDPQSVADADRTEGDGSPELVVPTEQLPLPTTSANPVLRMETPEEARRSILRWVGGMATFVIAAAILGGILLKVPYVALVPGTARDTEPLLEIEGIREYPSDGKLYLTTVRVRQRPNLWEYLWLRADDDAEIVPEQVILGDRTPEENREFNLGLMNDSKQVAIAVALEELGYDAVRTDAVVVSQIIGGSAAEDILELGDSIISINGETTLGVGDLVDRLGGFMPDDVITLVVERFADKTIYEFDVTLGDHPDKPGSAFLGIQPVDRLDFADGFGFEVDIESGAVGGPSAGLAFTLAVLDQLTEGELTGGESVAVTGTIDAAGNVGAVGGVLQKTAAVRDLGAEAFIVPAQLGDEALAAIELRAGDELKIISVNTIEEALDALDTLGGDVQAVRDFSQPVAG